MPTFYQRPLTWLLVGVFVVFDSLVLSGFSNEMTAEAGGIIFGQALIVARWIICGRAHWLWRAAAVPATVGGTTALVSLARDSLSTKLHFAQYLGGCTLTVAAMILGVATVVVFRDYPVTRHRHECSLWRISLGEILALTFVVAICSWIIREADFSWLMQNGDNVSWLMAAWVGGALITISARSMILMSIAVILPLTLPQRNLGTDASLIALAIAATSRLFYFLDQRESIQTEQQNT